MILCVYFQPIADKLPHDAHDDSSKETRSNRAQWDDIKHTIQLVLRTCVATAFDRGLITSKAKDKYFQSGRSQIITPTVAFWPLRKF